VKSIPLRVPRHLSTVHAATWTNSPEISGPYNDTTRASPVVERAVTSAPVPLSGFPNLSAVSEHARTSRPCFVPQPFLGFPPSELSPHRDRAPLSRPHASMQLSTDIEDEPPEVLLRPLSPTPTLARSSLDPATAMSSLSACRVAPTRFPIPLDHERRSRPLRPHHLLRSLDPPVSPFAPSRVSPGRRSILSWIFSPLELSPSTPRVLDPP
jgi:hypothetical protein